MTLDNTPVCVCVYVYNTTYQVKPICNLIGQYMYYYFVW